ncbi:MAG: tetratricopeptide repeat protein [Robiginitomaculum sp.]|nr:tetratricopeptide repeat protein [Robiginitomaculum sp.]
MPSEPPSPSETPITFTLQQYEDQIAKKIAEAESKFKTAHDEEKTQLGQQIEELRKRAANPEQALQEARATIAKLEDALTREGNSIGGDRMEAARQALEAGDFSIADTLFAEIEDQEMLAVERAARAAFSRGEIAAQDIRWADAAEHYARAARLHPNYEHLFYASEFAWRTGDYDKAITLGKDLLKITKTEYGETHEKYAVALNEYASSLQDTGKYEQSEPLHKQALEIVKQTIGEAHPNYAIHLNNLAGLYFVTGKYKLAEPLYLQALEIGKQTIGEAHPDYATNLNNLAGLYEDTEQYDLAESLYLQALEISKQTLGEAHPDYATRLNNLAVLYRVIGKYEQAEPLYLQAIQILETTLGPDHPNTLTVKSNYESLLKTWEK